MALRAAAHSATATRSQRHDHHAAITGASSPATAASVATATRKRISSRSHGTDEAARPRRVDGADPARALADDGTTFVPSGLLAVVRRKDAPRAGAHAARPGGRRPGMRGSARRRATSSGSSRRARVRPGSSRTGPPRRAGSALVGGLHLVDRRAPLRVHLRPAILDGRVGGRLGLRLDRALLRA